VPIQLEHAKTEEQLAWGLMQRKELPENSGMTFSYKEPDYQLFWMFNCLFDISVAFLDETKVIREVYPMKAYPEKMDPRRTVRKVADFKKYSINDPVVKFFMDRGVTSTFHSRYALEVNLNWFKNNRIKPGDAVWWRSDSPQGCVMRTIDLAPYLPLSEPLVIRFPDAAFRALRFPKDKSAYVVKFFDAEGNLVGKMAGSHHALAICPRPAAAIVIQ
jgi:uncharacterized membrane protein (UPF0127 family)